MPFGRMTSKARSCANTIAGHRGRRRGYQPRLPAQRRRSSPRGGQAAAGSTRLKSMAPLLGARQAPVSIRRARTGPNAQARGRWPRRAWNHKPPCGVVRACVAAAVSPASAAPTAVALALVNANALHAAARPPRLRRYLPRNHPSQGSRLESGGAEFQPRQQRDSSLALPRNGKLIAGRLPEAARWPPSTGTARSMPSSAGGVR